MEEEVEHLEEGRPSQRHPLEGHEYHKKTDAELVHIAKDAHKAAEAMKGHNTDAENKYRDQANDSATVRYYRQKHGMADWYKKKYGHIKEEVEQIQELKDTTLMSYAQKVHDDSLKHDKDPTKRSPEKRNKSVMGFSRAVNKLEARPVKEDAEQIDEMDSQGYKGTRDEYELGKGKEHTGKPVTAKKVKRDFAKILQKSIDKHNKAKQYTDKKISEEVEQVDEALSASARMVMALNREKEKRENKDKAREARDNRLTTQPAQRPIAVQSHVTAESVNEQTASKLGQEREEVPFDKPYKTTKSDTVKDKSGAVHTPMSRAKHLAKMAARKQAGIKEESEPDDSYEKTNTQAKRSLSKTAGMVKDLAKNAKTKKGSKADDKFEPEPELSSQIVKV